MIQMCAPFNMLVKANTFKYVNPDNGETDYLLSFSELLKYMSFSEALREIRTGFCDLHGEPLHEERLTQDDLAAYTGIPKRTIESWEEGTRVPSKWFQKMLLDYIFLDAYKFEIDPSLDL